MGSIDRIEQDISFSTGGRELTQLEAQLATLEESGQAVRSVPLRRHVVELLTAIGGGPSPAVLPHLRALRTDLEKMGLTTQALDAARAAVAVSEAEPISQGLTLTEDLLAQCVLEAALGLEDQSAAGFGRAANFARILASEHPELSIQVQLRQGDAYWVLSRSADAAEAYERARELLRDFAGAPQAEVFLRLGRVRRSAGRAADAEMMLRKALALAEGEYGSRHPTISSYCLELATLLTAERKLDSASEMVGRARQLRSGLAVSHPQLAELQIVQADLDRARNRLSDAESNYQSACVILEGAWGARSPVLAGALNDLASLYFSHGHYREAELHVKRSASILKSVFGHAHPERITVERNMAAGGAVPA